jgi:hypothetical protein
MSARLTTSAAIPIVHTIAILDEKPMNSRTIPRTTVRTPSQQWRIWISADRCQEGSLRRQVGETR